MEFYVSFINNIKKIYIINYVQNYKVTLILLFSKKLD